MQLAKLSKPMLIGVVAGALALLLGWVYMRRFEADVSGGLRVSVLTVTQNIPVGSVVTDRMLSVRSVPAAYVDDRAIVASDRTKVVGVTVTTQLKAQSTLQWTDLAVRTDVRNLSDSIAPGKRAITIRARSTDNGGSELMQPGDYVDVFAVMRGEAGNTATLLLQRVLVIAVGLATEMAGNKVENRDNKLLTLSLDLDEAQLISIANEKGRLAVALRNPTDQRVFEDMPDLSEADLLQARTKIQQRKSDGRRAAANTGPIKLTEAK
jgi:pilus assembly protein CpaB